MKKLSISIHSLHRWMIIPTVFWLEVLFHLWVGGSFPPSLNAMLLGFSLVVGGVLNLPAVLLPEKASKWYSAIVIFLCTAVMMAEYMVGNAYHYYIRPAIILNGAAGVVTEYGDVVINMIIANWLRILIALAPFFLVLFIPSKKSSRAVFAAASLACCIVGFFLGTYGLSGGMNRILTQYDFNNSVKKNGLILSTYIELSGSAERAAFVSVPSVFVPIETEPATISKAAEETVPEATETVPETEPVTVPKATEETVPEITQTVPETEPATVPKATEETVPEVTETVPETEPVTVPKATEETVTEVTETVPEAEPVTTPKAAEETVPEVTQTVPETEPATVPEATESATEAASTVPETEPETEPPREYHPHTLPQFDFQALAAKSDDWLMGGIYSYLAAQEPAMENEYTGLFAGKNLIFICAEAFNYTVIDPERTPTLYRLANFGIKFTNYYQCLWTGSTSGGEMANLSGLAMNCEMSTYTSQKPFNTIGRMLMNQGYFSRAYHNHNYTYYDRNITHENLGYEKFIAMGNGMEQGVDSVWPESDLQMFDFTLPQYIDNQPFSIYYMTVSGHSRYSQFGHEQAKKNWDLVEDLPYSDAVKAYLAANMELEKGLSLLVSSLEEAGIAEDTVIVLVPDHYPYGLGTAWGNSHDCLAELYGVEKYDIFDRDKNTLIIWSGSLESSFLEIDDPVCSVDILPTLSNLFGLEYDSRLCVGRDVFGTEEAISFWPDYSWITKYAKYDASTDTLTLLTDEPLPDGYAKRITGIVTNKNNFSKLVQRSQLFADLGKMLGN